MQYKNKKRKKTVAVTVFFILVFVIFIGKNVLASEAVPQNRLPNLAELKKELGKNIKFSTDKQTGKLNFLIKEDKGAPLWETKGKKKENQAISRDFLRAFGRYFGIRNPDNDLGLLKEKTDKMGMSHLLYNQKVSGVPVFGGQLVVHLKDKQAVVSINGGINPLENLDTNPKVDQGEALKLAKKYWVAEIKGEPQQTKDPKLYIYNKKFLHKQGDPANYLVWEVNLYSKNPYNHELFYVNALDGSLVGRHTAIKKAVNRRVYNCKAWDDYDACVLEDTINGIDHGRAEGVAARSITDIDNLYNYTGSIHDYYGTTFSRDGANDSGGLGDGTLNAYGVTDSYGRMDYDPFRGSYCPANAFFDDSIWSDGATINFCDGMAVKDVVGHEYAHGVSYFSILDGYGDYSGLDYEYESGALEEANADVLGEAAENYISGSSDWLMGEELAGGPFRSMANPGGINDSGYGVYPDKFSSTDFDCDYWEVHHNSTVVSHAAYLMAMGGTFNGCAISAIGKAKEEAVFYEAITGFYLTTNAGFNEAYDALNSACGALYGAGTADCQSVKKALRSVEMDQGGKCSGSPAVAPECDFARAPTITSISSDKESGNYRTGDVIDVDIYFSELVTSTGNITVTFNTGGSCTFTVSGQGMGTCDYTVRAEDMVYSHLDVTSISGAINDQDGNAMVNFSPGSNLSQNRTFALDDVAPIISGVDNGGIYRTDVTPTFNEGTATLNGEAFTSSQTITNDGDYTLVATDEAGNSTTVTFKIEKVVSSVPNLTYKRKKATSRMRLTFYGLSFPGKLKKKGFKVRFNGRRANILNARNTVNGLVVSVRFKYTKWPRGQYNLAMAYGYKVKKTWVRGSISKDNLFSIN